MTPAEIRAVLDAIDHAITALRRRRTAAVDAAEQLACLTLERGLQRELINSEIRLEHALAAERGTPADH
jgi:hypothetical protein